MFARIVHADWSMHPGGRWFASAWRTRSGWEVAGPWPVGDLATFVAGLADRRPGGPTLAAFDFPIGLPEAYGARTGFSDFRAALAGFGGGGWTDWFSPAATPDEIGPRRPFYPARPGAAKVRHLLDGLGVDSIADLTRRAERGGPGLPGAGCMFWLVGAKTVGKAAIHGWQEVVRPALASGAALWPFDGDLAGLAARRGLVLAESYPGDAYGQLGLRVRGKSRPAVLSGLAPALSRWAADRRITFGSELRSAIEAGFSAYGPRCGDAFDALAGLLAAIAVVDGHRPDGAPATAGVRIWEGWILGRDGSTGIPAPAGALGAGGEI